MSQDQYYYVSRISSVVETLADAIFARSIVPKIPSLGQMCQGIQIVANDHERASMSRELGITLHPALGKISGPCVPVRTLADPLMMDQMLHSIVPVAKTGSRAIHVWPSLLDLSPAEPAGLKGCIVYQYIL
jgi:hypothetical protein